MKKRKSSKNKRNTIPYPALNKQVNLKIRHEVMEEDYIDQLSDKEKDWLNRFNEEYNNTNFKHVGKRIHPRKYVTKTIQKTGEKVKRDFYKNESETRNNKRNYDALSVGKVNRGLTPVNTDIKFSSIIDNQNNPKEYEDKLVAYIDNKEFLKKRCKIF